MTIPDRDRLLAISDRLHPTMVELAKSVVLLMQAQPQPLAPQSVGTGTLLAIGDQHFVLTAAHVFEHADPSKPVFAAIGGQPVNLARTRHRTKPGSRLDLAIVPVGKPDGNRWAAAKFLTLADLAVPKRASESLATTAYVAMGFPHTKQQKRLRDGEPYSPSAYDFMTHYEPIRASNKMGADPMLHIAVGFDPEDFIGPNGDGRMADPHGMSGGGLWLIENALTTTSPAPRLVGIIIERHPAPENIILATRLENPLLALADLEPAARDGIASHYLGRSRASS